MWRPRLWGEREPSPSITEIGDDPQHRGILQPSSQSHCPIFHFLSTSNVIVTTRKSQNLLITKMCINAFFFYNKKKLALVSSIDDIRKKSSPARLFQFPFHSSNGALPSRWHSSVHYIPAVVEASIYLRESCRASEVPILRAITRRSHQSVYRSGSLLQRSVVAPGDGNARMTMEKNRKEREEWSENEDDMAPWPCSVRPWTSSTLPDNRERESLGRCGELGFPGIVETARISVEKYIVLIRDRNSVLMAEFIMNYWLIDLFIARQENPFTVYNSMINLRFLGWT